MTEVCAMLGGAGREGVGITKLREGRYEADKGEGAIKNKDFDGAMM